MSITRPTLMTEPFASSGNRNIIPVEASTDPNKINYASYSQGFPSVTMIPVEAGGKPPEGPDINGILYDDTSHTVFQNAGGQYRFDADFAAVVGGYSKGSVLQSNDGTSAYYSVVDNNLTDFNDDPTSIGSLWLPWAGDAVSGVPVATIEYFGTSTPPPGYLKADGAAVGRATYPELFAAIGTTFGAGDGSTTFNLPDLINRFAQGSNTPGQKIDAGLPNITGGVETDFCRIVSANGVFGVAVEVNRNVGTVTRQNTNSHFNFDASRSNPIYGASNTVQPPALTLLPCIKAFDAATNPGLIDITALAQEMANKTDKWAAAHASMPSGSYIDLTLPANGSSLIAPADGYIFANLTGSNSGSFSIDQYKEGSFIGTGMAVYGGVGAFFLYYPVSSKSKLKIINSTTATATYFRFIYAEGSKQ